VTALSLWRRKIICQELAINEAMRFRNKKVSRGEAKKTPREQEPSRGQLTFKN